MLAKNGIRGSVPNSSPFLRAVRLCLHTVRLSLCAVRPSLCNILMGLYHAQACSVELVSLSVMVFPDLDAGCSFVNKKLNSLTGSFLFMLYFSEKVFCF